MQGSHGRNGAPPASRTVDPTFASNWPAVAGASTTSVGAAGSRPAVSTTDRRGGRAAGVGFGGYWALGSGAAPIGRGHGAGLRGSQGCGWPGARGDGGGDGGEQVAGHDERDQAEDERQQRDLDDRDRADRAGESVPGPAPGGDAQRQPGGD